ncbi:MULTISPECIES: hypothetical protein [Pseudomonas syringae group genomosp. 2]|uniref:Uncharacterized protein n=2 Tax=Pseudomonas savastanoi TaxID=29438 RepID=A0A267KCI5_PSESS|nr:hypothetical protein [Pseudomonas savastanoi]ARD11393.1 hypothetical protein PSA3335_10140 [Pseudomonas savastanoi pv. savastanoi NCPPB 3335]MBA4702948.1 hypothetical protein [Pseudomonas savastanoi pv. savastanoi]PAB32816.1 hypothetical protein CC205_13560 [Pseudomonas savastanoi pv. nerii]RMN71275.1 hypothetical protein ALQ55_01174 [Pseudomonas savastanoi pv. savastanoi]RMT72256.1 hypothetical protein ALP42_02566 [Pseudomonas savastanoi pv. nerii]
MKISPEVEQRAINLSDAAARASLAGNHELSKKLEDSASALLEGSAPSFEEFAAMRNHNIERHEGKYISKQTQELYECWQAAGGAALT